MWTLEEALTYYKRQGAPADQNALRGLLREVQEENGGTIPSHLLKPIGETLGVKESFLLAILKRSPGLRLKDAHILELCCGPNCGKHTALAALAEQLCATHPKSITLKFVPCMRLCGKGPNIRLNGTLYHRADEALLRRLLSDL